MGVLRSLFTGRPDPMLAAAMEAPQNGAEAFAVDAESVPPEVFGMSSYASPISPAGRISRREAIQVPAVKRSRDLICGTLGTLPLDLFDADRKPVDPSPFTQPERSVPRSVTMANLFEDLFFEGIAWWRVTESDYRGFPLYVKRLKPGRVVVNDDLGRVYVDGKVVDDGELIRFDSPTDGLLTAGARAIRTCLRLDVASSNAADGVPAIEYFRPVGDADPADDEEIEEILAKYAEARRNGVRGYIPAALELVEAGWDPKKLQLAEQRQSGRLEIGLAAGIDPEELGVSTTSRTYQNSYDRRKQFVDFTIGLYRQAVEDRLSMGDVTPRGQYAKFNLSAFLRSDPLARYESYEKGLAVGALDGDDIARLEDKPPGSTRRPAASVTALPTRTEESA